MLNDTNIQYVTNQQGEKIAVQLPIKEWDSLKEKLEMWEDIKDFDEAIELNEKPIPFDEAKKILLENG